MGIGLAYLALGVFSGFLAGLLGIGGGLVIVPVLTAIFTVQQLAPQYVVHLALGTAFACILFSSTASFWAHHQHGAVRWDIVKHIAPGILAGVVLGSTVVAQIPGMYLKLFFGGLEFLVGTQMLLDLKPRTHRQLPGKVGMIGVGGFIGAVSSAGGIGGGVLSVPFLLWCNVTLRDTIGTSAAIGFPIAAGGTIGYMINGLAIKGLPAFSLGFVYLPALLGVVAASVVTAPLGARIAHRANGPWLRRIFALLLYAFGIKMLWVAWV